MTDGLHPNYFSPAGAGIYIVRNHRRVGRIRLTSIRVDRWPIDDATPEQCAAVRALAISEWVEHVAPKMSVPESTSFSADPSWWQFWILGTRETAVLRKIHRIEEGRRRRSRGSRKKKVASE